MKNFISLLVLVAANATALCLLPWEWGVLLLLASIFSLAWIAWKFLLPTRTIGHTLAAAIPQKRLRSLAAGETFQGNGFTFTFPVACEVHQALLDGREALGLKPQFKLTGRHQDWLLLISALSREELKIKLGQRLEKACSWFQQLRAGVFVPMQLGSLHGERRAFQTVRKGKPIRGESVYLGDQDYSIGWSVIGPADSSAPLAEKFRELVCLIERIPAL